MNETQPFNAPVIVNPQGKPARTSAPDVCPQCGAGPDVRKPSGGFGTPWTVCPCGHEWKDRVFRER